MTIPYECSWRLLGREVELRLGKRRKVQGRTSVGVRGEHGDQWARVGKVAEARRRLRREDHGKGSAKAKLAAQAIATALKPDSRTVRTVPRPNALILRSDNPPLRLHYAAASPSMSSSAIPMSFILR